MCLISIKCYSKLNKMTEMFIWCSFFAATVVLVFAKLTDNSYGNEVQCKKTITMPCYMEASLTADSDVDKIKDSDEIYIQQEVQKRVETVLKEMEENITSNVMAEAELRIQKQIKKVTEQNNVGNIQVHKDILNLRNTLNSVHDSMLTKDYHRGKQLESQQKLITKLSSDNNGVVYTRWGRKECQKNGTELVYSGIVTGGDSRDSGSPAQPVCAPLDPDLGPDSSSAKIAPFYGAQYKDNYFGANLLNNDVPCAVCRAIKVTSVVMIPGKAACHTGWKMEYSGNLAGGHFGQPAASNFVCMDSTPDVVVGGNMDQPGTLFVPVKVWCNSLKCPPYKRGKNIKCAVCVK